MSVIEFSDDFFIDLFRGLKDSEDYFPLNSSDYRMIEKGETTKYEWLRYKVAEWINRVRWANKMAFFITYSKENTETLTLDYMDLENERGGYYLNGKTLYRELSSLRYNCCSNGGTITLNKNDAEILDAVMDRIASRILL